MLWCLAYFAAVVGFILITALVMGRLYGRMPPCLPTDRRLFVVVPAKGNGTDMEAAVATASTRRDKDARRFLILLDEGLDEEGQACAVLLAAEHSFVYVCKGDSLYSLIMALNQEK